ncbi:MAG: type II toxin-antitoxin system HicB family antitoxin [Candidatus Wallbacteria bacterium]|nr:type II toxin-antitoxin system HicB family antitoxin [Candidatus Wallbacteria bacterium]
MKDVLTYDGYIGSVHFSTDDRIFYGKLEGIEDLITFEGETVEQLVRAFQDAVDDYLVLCKQTGKDPQKPCKGSLNIRIKPETHRKAAEKAAILGISLNQLIQKALDRELRK